LFFEETLRYFVICVFATWRQECM